jgi:hypothetical protein
LLLLLIYQTIKTMTTYYQISNRPYLVLPGNGGILLTSNNINSKNQGLDANRVQGTIVDAMARVNAALRNINR